MTRLGRTAVAVILALVLATTGALAQGGLTILGSFRPPPASGDLLVILAIGSDVGPPHRPGNPLRGRADGIHLLMVDTVASRMTVVDIPRDSAIGGTKVNAHLAFGGPDRLEAELEAWSGVAIDYWALGSFRSVERIAEGLGGIPVTVEVPMNDPFSGTALAPGPTVLDPGQALAFTRDRKSLPDGDIGRSRNQTRLLLAVLEQLRTQQPSLTDLVGYVQLFSSNVVTNIPPSQILPLATTALRLDPASIRHVTLRGPFATIGGQSVIRVQPGDVFVRAQAGDVGP